MKIRNLIVILSIAPVISCVPQAFKLPDTMSINVRTDLCNLLSKVGLGDQIQACLAATSITDTQKAALCKSTANLNDSDKNLLRKNLSADQIASCDILSPATTATPISGSGSTTTGSTGTESPVATPTATPTADLNGGSGGSGGNGNTNGNPTPSPTNSIIPTATPTASTSTYYGGGGGGSGGYNGGSSNGGNTSGGPPNPVVQVSATVNPANPGIR